MRNSGKQDRNVKPKGSETKRDLEDDVDALFRLSLPEFTGARNTLAARLKKSGRGDEAFLVKALVKPSISAWAVNQLYWNHRDAFDRLIASGERFHKAQASPLAAKLANLRTALDARREALTHLSDLATSLLRDAGHNPALDTVRRITTTLEAMSAMPIGASRSDAPRPGRLTHDVDPPGFDSLASLIPGAGVKEPTEAPARIDLNRASQKSRSAPTKTRRKPAPDTQVRQLEESRKAKIAAAKVSLQQAKRSLTEARARAQSLEVTQKKVYAEAKKAEKHRRDAEESLEKARAVAEDAAQRAQSVAVDVKEAATALEDAQRTVERASKELESLFRESSRR
jgi:DNA repair exonuclease SbcCD ATPase subunit